MQIMQTYAGHELATLEYDGEPVWLASQVGEALGYVDNKSIARAVRRNWSEDFEAGVEFHLLRGDELAAVKVAAGPVAIPATASSVMVLTQAGVDAVLQLSGAIRGDVLAHYLVRALELQTGETFHQLRPAQHESHTYATPTVIARRAGTTSAAVGRAISGIEVDGRPLRGHPDEAYCRTLIKGRLHTEGDCVAYEYTPLAERLIRRELQRRAGA